eukprot:CAMPEP_0174742452 /NCGR_PEP_ID=MMETSP1094-20130205/78921_1 /TAXON_ID=156173 /ORGANISM="Chrysochromulina brevifilum, Strain UTEX LB 985" /LENGTH=124 /DNA_ID=CAMNT_0015946507 /DNA_START=25 /DNA_END=395 /DNA_ORIENTATION=+
MGCAGSKTPDHRHTPTNISPESTLSRPPNGSSSPLSQPAGSAQKTGSRSVMRRHSAGGRTVTDTGYHSDVKTDMRFQTRHISLQRITTGEDALSLLKGKYEIEGGVVLGKGACGKVVSVTNRIS